MSRRRADGSGSLDRLQCERGGCAGHPHRAAAALPLFAAGDGGKRQARDRDGDGFGLYRAVATRGREGAVYHPGGGDRADAEGRYRRYWHCAGADDEPDYAIRPDDAARGVALDWAGKHEYREPDGGVHLALEKSRTVYQCGLWETNPIAQGRKESTQMTRLVALWSEFSTAAGRKSRRRE